MKLQERGRVDMSQQRDTAFAASLVVASLALAVLLARRRRRLPARFDLQRLVRPCVLRLAPYTFPPRFGLAEAPVLLDANENPHGSTVEALDAALHRYPDPRQARLKAAIAGLRGCAPSQVVVGCGSDEIIDLLIRVTCEPGRDSILVCSPTYAMYQIFASVNDVSTVDVPLSADDYQLRVGAILQSLTPRVKLVFLCSPGNPTGRLLRRADIEAIAAAATGSLRCRQPLLPPPSATASSSLRRRALSIAAVPEPALLLPAAAGSLVVVDEAYVDFAPDEAAASCVPLVGRTPNLVVSQTFSKAWGLAGARVGVAVAPEPLVSALDRVKATTLLARPHGRRADTSITHVT